MPEPVVDRPDFPVLVVAYDDKARAALAASTAAYGVGAIPCASFREAEDYALTGCYRGILVDLATMVKAKDEEKIVAHTLTGLYPTLRVKSMGGMLIPMIMAGDAKQDKSLKDFFTTTCEGFVPRSLRAHRRRDFCIPTLIDDQRGFTLNISWSGAFIVHIGPEHFRVGDELAVAFRFEAESELRVEVVVARIQSWGERRPPGIGVWFKDMGPELEKSLAALLKTDKDKERDRLAK